MLQTARKKIYRRRSPNPVHHPGRQMVKILYDRTRLQVRGQVRPLSHAHLKPRAFRQTKTLHPHISRTHYISRTHLRTSKTTNNHDNKRIPLEIFYRKFYFCDKISQYERGSAPRPKTRPPTRKKRSPNTNQTNTKTTRNTKNKNKREKTRRQRQFWPLICSLKRRKTEQCQWRIRNYEKRPFAD